MTTRPLRGRPTQSEAQAIEHRLREAAIEAFVDNGFEGTTMEAVAAAAGVTKRTLYAKYADKHALFAAVIPQALADMPFRGMAIEAPVGALSDALRQSARQIIERLVDPTAVRLRRLAMIEAHRIAELDPVEGADMWSMSLQSIVHLLALHAEAGAIVADDLEVAADLFLAMVAGSPTMWADFGVFRSPEELECHIARLSICSSREFSREADRVGGAVSGQLIQSLPLQRGDTMQVGERCCRGWERP